MIDQFTLAVHLNKKLSRMKNPIRIALGLVILAVIIGSYTAFHYARENFLYRVRDYSQNALEWVNPKTQNVPLLPVSMQKQFAHYYLQYYFSPWTLQHSYYDWQIPYLRKEIQDTVHNYIRYPGYGINHLPNSSATFKNMAKNINLAHFPNAFIKVITIENTDIRNLPTEQPVFGNFNQAGQGYPFDNLQVTSLAANTPAVILQKTQDGVWSFIIAHNVQGWVQSNALATVDANFIQRWKTPHFVALIKNKIPIKDNHVVRFTADIGKIFPAAEDAGTKKYFAVLIAVPDSNQHAVIKIAHINRDNAAKWPLLPTQHNIASIMNAMIGVKYGWGGMIDDSDCSLTTMNLFATFGLWLPRHSALQVDTKDAISLRKMTDSEKEKIILSQGVPFLTLLHMPGHIVIYLGEKKGRIFIFQTAWGLKTHTVFGKSDRAIIGGTVITPIDLGKNDINVSQTWLNRIDKMRVLGKT